MTKTVPHGLFITGTNTEVGKTHVAAMIARAFVESGVAVGVYKPVASGCRYEGGELVSDDAVALWEAAGRPGTLHDVCPQRFEAPVAPHVAAEMAGRAVDERLLIVGFRFWAERADVVIVEGAGGLMSPLTRTAYNADFAAELGLPLVVVAANELGVINTTLQTLITAAAHNPPLPVAAVVLNQCKEDPTDASLPTNAAELAPRCGGVPLVSVAFGQERFEDGSSLSLFLHRPG